MPRRLRFSSGGYVFHVLNRGAGRQTLFSTEQDYDAFVALWLTVTHSQRWHAFHGTAGTGPVYQGRFKSFPVQEDGHFLSVARYVERNSLRANLAPRAELWKWNSLWHWDRRSAVITLDPWPIPRPMLWLEHVNEPQSEAEVAAIRQSVERGRPYGNSGWTRSTAKTLGLESTLRSRGSPGRVW